MTKKDFELIASMLKSCLDDNVNIKNTIEYITLKLSDKYPRFNKDKFLKACGVIIDNQ